MHRSLILLLLLLSMTALVSAQGPHPPAVNPARQPQEPDTASGQWVQGVYVPVELEPVDVSDLPPATPEDHGNDLCSNAPLLSLDTATAGDNLITNDMTTSPDDPVLSCTWGTPSDPRGHRTVWYKFVAPASGRLKAQTTFVPSSYEDSYDTILSIYQAPNEDCSLLQPVACNDDSTGFFSETSAFVIQGRTYYVEVADWHFAVNNDATLRLGIVLTPGPSFWREVGTMPVPRSRHAVVRVGTDFYIIAGQTVVEGNPVRDGRTDRFDSLTNTWDEGTPLPGPDGFGYSNTTAAYVDGRIYVPAGYVGDNDNYDGTHWMYDVATDAWSVNSASMTEASNIDQPYAWSVAVPYPSLEGYFLTGGLLEGDPIPHFPADDVEITDNMAFFSPNGNDGTWLEQASMSRARYAHVAGRVGNEICVAGGVGKSSDVQAVVLQNTECYSIASSSWSPAGSLNFGRFMAGSAIGPDGRWYVFGGIGVDQEGGFVPINVTEVYDPVTNSWAVLDSRYNLGHPDEADDPMDQDTPPRAWPRGGFVGSTLWVFGGEIWQDFRAVSPFYEKLPLPVQQLNLPLIAKSGVRTEPNDTFNQSLPVLLNHPTVQDFASEEDLFDVYHFHVPPPGTVVTATVSSIPAGSDYDIFLYSESKFLVGSGGAVGNLPDTAVTFTLTPGTYYAVVLRKFGEPTTDLYQIVVRDQ